MSLWQSVLLGVVQGVFMFFPVSSTSHLVLTQHLMLQRGAEFPDPESPEMIFFDLVVHVGTLVSIAVVFRKSLGHFLRRLVEDVRRVVGEGYSGAWAPARSSLYLRLALLGCFSVLVTGAIGYPMRDLFSEVFATPAAVVVTLTATGGILWWTDGLSPRQRGLRNVTLWMALVIGLAQALALMPGLSRSGMTIAFALFVGLRRRWAAEYSFFIAFPTILGASLLQGLEVLEGGGVAGVGFGAFAVGFVVSALVGIVALRIVLRLLYRARLRYFSYYVWALALVIGVGIAAGTFQGAV